LFWVQSSQNNTVSGFKSGQSVFIIDAYHHVGLKACAAVPALYRDFGAI